ncbi:Hypothetical protein Bdt_2573 [Bdellovibrio bacteriovorus str. Tiberius]|uniref:Uncharacterized protein n=1 Tax=Bdellovibrio bacteriovorus str. Tiberius TaxID=1069642 RepID=K7YQU5_BDEBC|nr:Hypothetical protein Bdt_2573 [Bdellovibrio bacteriovorus str. Tiberius]
MIETSNFGIMVTSGICWKPKSIGDFMVKEAFAAQGV